MIRNLIQLYDHTVEIEQQLPARGPRKTGPTVPEFVERLDEFVQNFTTLRNELTEVLARLEVETYEERHDALQQEHLKTLDRNLHRPVAVEPTADPKKQNQVTRVHKPGFYWRDKVFRPEEVTILRHDGRQESRRQNG